MAQSKSLSLPIKNGGIFHSYVNVYQGVTIIYYQPPWRSGAAADCDQAHLAEPETHSSLGAPKAARNGEKMEI
jgi:hypothetical protein